MYAADASVVVSQLGKKQCIAFDLIDHAMLVSDAA
jgi:hypothetical protein